MISFKEKNEEEFASIMVFSGFKIVARPRFGLNSKDRGKIQIFLSSKTKDIKRLKGENLDNLQGKKYELWLI
jgi:hypothetical protein